MFLTDIKKERKKTDEELYFETKELLLDNSTENY